MKYVDWDEVKAFFMDKSETKWYCVAALFLLGVLTGGVLF